MIRLSIMWPFHPGFHTPDLRVCDQVWRYANEQGSDTRGLGTLVKSHFWDLQEKMKERPISTPTAPTLPSVWEPQLYIPWHVWNGRKSNLFLLESLQFCTSADCMVNIFSLFSPVIFLNSNLVFLKWEKNTDQKKMARGWHFISGFSFLYHKCFSCRMLFWGGGRRIWKTVRKWVGKNFVTLWNTECLSISFLLSSFSSWAWDWIWPHSPHSWLVYFIQTLITQGSINVCWFSSTPTD